MRKLFLLASVAVLTACAPASVEDNYRTDEPVATSSSPRTTRFNHEPTSYLIKDPETGCEYIVEEGITPRIAADGISHKGCSS